MYITLHNTYSFQTFGGQVTIHEIYNAKRLLSLHVDWRIRLNQ